MWKTVHNEQNEGGTGELDKHLSTKTTTENNLEQHIELISEAIQSACYATFLKTTTRKKNNNKKTVPWWTDNLTIIRKRVNAYRRLFQRTKHDEKLREDRKKNYGEANRTYQTEIKKEKTKLMEGILQRDSFHKPMVTSLQTGSRENRSKSTITNLTKQDGSETRNTKETMEVLLDYLFEDDNTEENQYQKQLRKTVEQPIKTIDDIEFSREEIKQAIESFNDKKSTGN